MTNKETQEKINQLSMYEQNLQYIANQRQRFQAQELELTEALNELTEKEEAYKIIGNIMIKQEKEKITKDLEDQKELLKTRIQTIRNQEEKIKKESTQLQKEIMTDLEKNK
ncbi:prefoldin subunit [Candidatus Woesearchaeota archaeon]|nr:prefoldin subunit [Candidatus Woesearchaeota archaeon]